LNNFSIARSYTKNLSNYPKSLAQSPKEKLAFRNVKYLMMFEL